MPFFISILVISYIKGKFTYLFDKAYIRKYVYFCNLKKRNENEATTSSYLCHLTIVLGLCT